jgi:Aspartyl/Asparaginyl beta-hydroxylase
VNIEEPLRHLGAVDADALRSAVLALDPQAWRAQEHRQNAYEVHKQTQSIVLVFCDGPMHALTVSKEPGWDALAGAAVPVMHGIIERCYPKGGTIIRAMAAKLLAGGRITPHIDTHSSFRLSHRIHVPLTTNSRVRFMIDGRPYRFEPGQAYEINNQKTHSVMNSGDEDRITFIFDYLPPGAALSREAIAAGD